MGGGERERVAVSLVLIPRERERHREEGGGNLCNLFQYMWIGGEEVGEKESGLT